MRLWGSCVPSRSVPACVGVRTVLHALRTPLAVLVPALVVAVPLFAYKYGARFSSPFDFGSSYQLTVTDMTSYHQSWSNTLFDGRILPVSAAALTDTFPFLAVDPAPLKDWGFAEVMPGGLFVMVPLALAALACPFLRKRMRVRGHAGMWPTLVMFLLLGLLIRPFRRAAGWPWMALYRRWAGCLCWLRFL